MWPFQTGSSVRSGSFQDEIVDTAGVQQLSEQQPRGPAPMIATFVRNTCLPDYYRLGRHGSRDAAAATCIDNYII